MEANQPSHPALPEFWQWQDRGVQRSLSQLMWVSFKMPGKWLCWPHPHSEIFFWELLTKLQPKEQELTHLSSTHALHSHTQTCPRCTWAGIEQAKFTFVSERPQSGILPRHTPVLSMKVCSQHVFITAACHSLSASALLVLLLNTNLCTELKTASWAPDHELSAVFYYLQLKLAMNKEINKLLCYYSLYVEREKNPKPRVLFKMDLALYTVCESTQP